MKQPLAMPCTQEQAKEMTELLRKHGIEIGYNYNKNYTILTNSYSDEPNCVGFTNMKACIDNDRAIKRTLIPYNPTLFLESLGIVEQKWEDRTRGEHEYYIYETLEGKIFGRIKVGNVWHPLTWNLKGLFYDIEQTDTWDLIPYTPIKAQLLAEKEELKKRIEEIDNQLK